MYKVFIKIFNKYYSADIKDAIEQGKQIEYAEIFQKGYNEGRRISTTILESEINKHRAIAYDEGYQQGYEVCRKETLKEVYEKLVQEIKETTREEVLAENKERYSVE